MFNKELYTHRFQKLIFLLLFTDVFHKDFPSVIELAWEKKLLQVREKSGNLIARIYGNPEYVVTSHCSLLQIQSRVASLSLLTCDGYPLSIENLSTVDEILMDIPYEIPRNEANSSSEEEWEYVLLKENMNVHAFNLSTERRLQSFHIELHMEHVEEQRAFDVSLLLK